MDVGEVTTWVKDGRYCRSLYRIGHALTFPLPVLHEAKPEPVVEAIDAAGPEPNATHEADKSDENNPSNVTDTFAVEMAELEAELRTLEQLEKEVIREKTNEGAKTQD